MPFLHELGQLSYKRAVNLVGRRWVNLVYPAAFLYLLIIRTHNISEQFWLLGDQIRDWRIAMGPFTSLPLTGAPSSAGGTMLGPVYYWVLWSIRVVLGPLFDNLPHAGGIGLSVLQSAADVLLLYAIVQRLGTITLSLAIVVFAATSPFDMALTAAIWNPTVAVALSKVTVAILLLRETWSMLWVCVLVAVAWLSVQAHVGSIFTAAVAIGWVVVRPMLDKRPGRSLSVLRAAVEIVLLLQIPYALYHWQHPGAPGPNAVSGSVGYALQHPAELQMAGSGRAFGYVMDFLLFAPWAFPWAGTLLLVAAAISVWLWRREPRVVVASVAPLAMAVLGFSAWRGRMGEHYWYLPLVPSAAMVLALPLAAISRPRTKAIFCAVALIVVAAIQPARCRAAWQIHRLPAYAAVVRGSRQVVRQAPQVRTIVAPFLPPTSDPTFVYELLGGRISPAATVIAYIDPEGHVRYETSR